MKKKLWVSFVIFCVLSISSIAIYANHQSFRKSTTDVPVVSPQPSFNILSLDRMVYTQNAKELGDASDLIVVAKVIPGKENKLITSPDGQYIVSGYTITNLEVISVIKGDLDAETVTITEGYFSVPVEDGNVDMWTKEAYLPANENEEYLFFLKKYDIHEDIFPNMYYPVDLQYGKYVLTFPTSSLMSNSNTAYEKFEVLNNKYSRNYAEWYEEVYNTFISVYLSDAEIADNTNENDSTDADTNIEIDASVFHTIDTMDSAE